MGQVIVAAQLVGHGVDISQRGVVESDPCQVLGIRHLGPGLHIVPVGHSLGQIVDNLINGLDGCRVGEGICVGGDISLDRMGQRVHSRGRSQGGGHPHHQLRVIDGNGGRHSPVHNAHFYLPGRVGDDAEAGNLRSSSRGRVHRHQGRQGLMGLIHALIVGNLAAVASHQANALGAVMGGAAAQGEDTVTSILMVEGLPLHHVGVLGVGLCLAKHGGIHASLLQDGLNPGGHGVGGQKLVGDDHGLGAAQALHQMACFRHRALAKYVSTGNKIISRHSFSSFLTWFYRDHAPTDCQTF